MFLKGYILPNHNYVLSSSPSLFLSLLATFTIISDNVTKWKVDGVCLKMPLGITLGGPIGNTFTTTSTFLLKEKSVESEERARASYLNKS